MVHKMSKIGDSWAKVYLSEPQISANYMITLRYGLDYISLKHLLRIPLLISQICKTWKSKQIVVNEMQSGLFFIAPARPPSHLSLVKIELNCSQSWCCYWSICQMFCVKTLIRIWIDPALMLAGNSVKIYQRVGTK